MTIQINPDAVVDVIERVIVRPPNMWKVIFHNDDKTSMEFVVHLLMAHFDKAMDAAIRIMMEVHEKGRGMAGIYTKEIARQKSNDSMEEARHHDFPLVLTIEEV